MSVSPDNQIRTALVGYEEQRSKVPFAIVDQNSETKCLELTINFSPESTEFNTLKFQISNPQDINQSRKEILELVNWLMNDVFQVDIEKAKNLSDQIDKEGFQSLWSSETGKGNMNETISRIFQNIDTKEGVTLPHIMCHDFNAFAISVFELIRAINKGLSSSDNISEIADIITIYHMYKGVAGINASTYTIRKTALETPHEKFVVPTLKLMLWINGLVENIDKYIPVPVES